VKTIFICDDQPEMMERFKERHKDQYEIRAFNCITDLRRAIWECKKKPDLVLLDLFWARENVDPSVKEQADSSLKHFQAEAEGLVNKINMAYMPNGKEALAALRKEYSANQLPIMIYSKTGQLLLGQDDLRIMADLDAGWLMKEQYNINRDIESIMIEHHIEGARSLSKRKPKNFYWSVFFAALGALIGYFLNAFLP